jgi:hypothetical protein
LKYTRSVTEEAKHGGKCGALLKYETCNSQECPRDCKGAWSTGACSKTCGGGMKVKTYSVLVKPNSSGKQCPKVQREEHACNTQKCPPVNCQVSGWKAGHNAKCSQCWDGSESSAYNVKHTRTVTVSPKNGGAACPALTKNTNCRSTLKRCSSTKSTTWHTKGTTTWLSSRGTVNYLDRHRPSCYSGQALQSFKLSRSGANMKYSYTCVQATKKNDGHRSRSTSNNDGGNWQMHYLDRHRVTCPSGVLSEFHLNSHGSRDNGYCWTETCTKVCPNNPWYNPFKRCSYPCQKCGKGMKYDYKCIGAQTGSSDRYTSYDNFDKKEVIYLDRHSLSCGTNQAIAEFKLQTKGNEVRYHYKCRNLGAL